MIGLRIESEAIPCWRYAHVFRKTDGSLALRGNRVDLDLAARGPTTGPELEAEFATQTRLIIDLTAIATAVAPIAESGEE